MKKQELKEYQLTECKLLIAVIHRAGTPLDNIQSALDEYKNEFEEWQTARQKEEQEAKNLKIEKS